MDDSDKIRKYIRLIVNGNNSKVNPTYVWVITDDAFHELRGSPADLDDLIRDNKDIFGMFGITIDNSNFIQYQGKNVTDNMGQSL